MEKNVNKYKVKESNINKLKEYLSNNVKGTADSFGCEKNINK